MIVIQKCIDMKYLKIIGMFCVAILVLPFATAAHTSMKLEMSATVVDSDGNPVEGATITDVDGNRLATTNILGQFFALADLNSTIEIQAEGYTSVMAEATAELDTIALESQNDMVQVAFRQVAKDDLLGGVSTVDFNELLQKNYITWSLDGMEALTSGFHGNLWGMDQYLLLVDGVPRDINNVFPTEIDHITFLKGAPAVALYGSRAARGVILVTTKRGEIDEQKFSIRANTGLHTPRALPNYLGSVEYMRLFNEARRNDGLADLFSEETIANADTMQSAFRQYRFPDVDFLSSEFIHDFYNRTDVIGEVIGGGKRARYYANFGFATTGSSLNFGNAIGNRGENRFNIRGNVDVNINDYITANISTTAIFFTRRGVNTDYWAQAATMRPHRFSPLIPISAVDTSNQDAMDYVNTALIVDDRYILGGTSGDLTNPFADVYVGGHNRFNSRLFQFNTGITADLGNLTEGLKFRSNLAIDYTTQYSIAFNNQYAVYEPVWRNDTIISLTKFGNDARTGVQNVSGSWYSQTQAFSGQLDYQRTFGGIHNVSGLVLANGFLIGESGVYHSTSNANLGFNAAYNYDRRYYFDFTGALVHSNRLPQENRLAFSPTFTLGWRISEEGFMQNVGAVDNLILSASAGILHTDMDIAGPHLYRANYTFTDGAWYNWRDGSSVRTFDLRRGENFNLDFPRREEISATLRGSFFDNMINFETSVFRHRMTGMVVQSDVLFPMFFRTWWPVYTNIPFANYNEDERTGVEFSLNLNEQVGQVGLRLGVFGTYYETVARKRAEMWEFDYQNREGRPIDAIWGLESLGFFTSLEDIANSPSQIAFGDVAPGDLKYKDQNGDGLIDTRDEVMLGRAGWFGAPMTLGVNVSATWRNFTIFAKGVGRFGAYDLRDDSYHWINGEEKYSEVVRNRWTPETANTATFPRLTTGAGTNNFRNSDFWMYSTNRFELGKVQITYRLPENILAGTRIQGLEMYISGFNLLTIAQERETLELNIGGAPRTRLFNIGVKAGF